MSRDERIARLVVYVTVAAGVGAAGAWAIAAPGVGAWLAVGAALWVVAVGLKLVLSAVVWGPLEARGALVGAAAMGLLSAALELGLVALYLQKHVPPGLPEALGLGVGAGAVEALALGVVAALERAEAEGAPPTRPLDALAFPVERLLVALPGHVGSRALLAAAFAGLGGGWAAIAVATFTMVDAVPTYAERAAWSWADARTLWGYYAGAGAIGWLEVALALVAWRALPFPG